MRDQGEAVIDGAGNIVQVVGTLLDITDPKGAEHELRLSESRLAEALRVARLGHWEFDVATATTWWPAQTFALFDLPVKAGAPGVEAFLKLMSEEDQGPL